ncbi:hypothetical protein [Ornithinimicrobium kibberense]|uniref:hypothetical protein n=1 Tax=Ornithinimicrobium kibberense TaxID=282060 RepID=UPI003616BA21
MLVTATMRAASCPTQLTWHETGTVRRPHDGAAAVRQTPDHAPCRGHRSARFG